MGDILPFKRKIEPSKIELSVTESDVSGLTVGDTRIGKDWLNLEIEVLLPMQLCIRGLKGGTSNSSVALNRQQYQGWSLDALIDFAKTSNQNDWIHKSPERRVIYLFN